MTEIKMIGFDWDGTLVDSMIEVKSNAFAEAVVEFHPSLKDKKQVIRDIYLRTRGTPRVDQLTQVENRFEVEKLEDDEVDKWSEQFTNNYIDVVPPLFEDTVSTVQELIDKDYMIYLSSSVPQKDLEETLEKYEDIDGSLFEYVLGTRDNAPSGYSLDEMPVKEKRFRKGPGHIHYVCEEKGMDPQNVVFVGDGTEDVKGANEAGATSIGLVDPRMPGEVKSSMENAGADYILESRDSILDLELFNPDNLYR